MSTGTLLAIAIKTASREPMTALDGAEISTEHGVTGDSRGGVRHRQVTIVAREAWERTCSVLGSEVHWTARRANLLVEGMELENTKGHVLRIGPVRLEITGETLPCARMDEAHPGLQEALQPEWRAGVTAMVLSGGAVSPGDAATWEARDQD